jgi:hypothetical protein
MKYKHLTICNNGSIGDFLMSMLVLDRVHLEHSSMSFAIVSPRNISLWKDIAQSYSYIQILKYPFHIISLIFKKGVYIFPIDSNHFAWHQKVIAYILKFLGNETIAFSFEKKQIPFFLTKKVIIQDTNIFYTDKLCRALDLVGISYAQESIFFRYPVSEIRHPKPVIVFHPFGASDGRSFLGEKYKRIIEMLVLSFPEHDIFVTGSEKDAERIQDISSQTSVHYFFGKSMQEIISLIASSKLFIGVDTGITHIANSLHKKTLVLAEQGTPNWLPFYNDQATIVFCVQDSKSSMYEGKEYLFSEAKGRIRYLDRIPLEVIENYIQRLAYEIKS